MKKIIGTLSVAVIAGAMFFTIVGVKSTSKDTILASLITMNTANAEETVEPNCSWGKDLVPTPIRKEIYTLSTGVKCLLEGIPVGFTGTYTHAEGLAGETRSCEWFAFACCDQNKVGTFMFY